MFEHIFSMIAVLCYFASALRILCFESNSATHKRLHEIMAMALIASFMGQSVNILFLKDPVTIWDAFLGVVLLVVICKAKGNIAKLLWSKTYDL